MKRNYNNTTLELQITYSNTLEDDISKLFISDDHDTPIPENKIVTKNLTMWGTKNI